MIDHVCDDSGNDLVITEENVDLIYIYSTNETNDISKNEYDKIFHKHYASL